MRDLSRQELIERRRKLLLELRSVDEALDRLPELPEKRTSIRATALQMARAREKLTASTLGKRAVTTANTAGRVLNQMKNDGDLVKLDFGKGYALVSTRGCRAEK